MLETFVKTLPLVGLFAYCYALVKLSAWASRWLWWGVGPAYDESALRVVEPVATHDQPAVIAPCAALLSVEGRGDA